MTTPTEDARAALAEWDAQGMRPEYRIEHNVANALRALIEPPTDDDHALLAAVAGDRGLSSVQCDALADELSALGFRRQVSHPEPVTDEVIEQVRAIFRDPNVLGILEAARAVRLPVPEEENP